MEVPLLINNPAVPVRVRLIDEAFPNCVNPPNLNVPALKPPAPTNIVFPTANEGVLVEPLVHPKLIPPVFVEDIMMFSLNKSLLL